MIYHMFISGNNVAGTTYINNPDIDFAPNEEIVLLFDSVDNYSMLLSNEKTSFPIESRSSVTDHVFSNDGRFSFTGRITASPTYIRTRIEWDKNTDKNAPANTPRVRSAYEVVKAARDSRAAISLTTEEFDITNYVITSFEFTREGPLNMGVFSITLEEMRTRNIGTTVLATNISSDIEAGKSNKNTGSKQSAKTSPPTSTELETWNRNEKNTEMFQQFFLETGKGGEFVPAGTESPKFSVGLN